MKLQHVYYKYGSTKFINNYVIAKADKLCNHKHNTKKTCPAGIY